MIVVGSLAVTVFSIWIGTSLYIKKPGGVEKKADHAHAE
jgi:hypothetical protein